MSDATYWALAAARVTSLGTVALKTPAKQVGIWRLDGLP